MITWGFPKALFSYLIILNQFIRTHVLKRNDESFYSHSSIKPQTQRISVSLNIKSLSVQMSHLCKMSLKQIIFGITLILSSTSGVIIDCEFSEKKFFSNKIDMYTCESVELVTSEDDSHITEISGTHLNGKNNTEVKQFSAINQGVEFFPGGLSSFFPNLEAVFIKNSSLKFVFNSDLSGLSYLKYFAVIENEIEVVPPKLFEDNSALIEIHFEKNNITSISEDLLDFMEEPKVLHFYGNPCMSEDFNGTDIIEIKENLKAKCPLKSEVLGEFEDIKIKKLSSQINNLEEALEDERSKLKEPKDVPDGDKKMIVQLEKRIENLVYEKKAHLIYEDETNQTLATNAIKIQNLTEDNATYKLNNENLSANLTENLENLELTRADKDQLTKTVNSLNEEIADEKRTTKILNTLISKMADETAQIKIINASLNEKLETVTKELKKEIDQLNSEFSKLKTEKEKLAKDSGNTIKTLTSINTELKKKNSRDIAMMSYYDNLIAHTQTRKVDK